MKPKDVPEIVRNQNAYMQTTCEALEIFSGNIKPFVLKLLDQQLSAESAFAAKQRVAPINVLPKIVDKLTNIYQTAVVREVLDGTDSDKKILNWYEEKFDMNTQMNSANELFNLNSATLIQPYVYKGKPFLRSIKNDKFVVYSDDPIQPNVPTHVILIYKYNEKTLYHVYSDDEIYIVDDRGEVQGKEMFEMGLDGINPVGKIPFIYGNASKYDLIPCADEDGLTIVKLIPVMLTDLNHAAMFQAFSILYMINGKTQKLKYAPNAMWDISKDPEQDEKPEIGQIKPTVDYAQVLDLIQTELSMWLGTKGIKSSSISGLTKENFASGISKMIDEMDTFEARQKQVTSFTQIEKDFWDLIQNYLHPYWTKLRLIENVGLFSTDCKIKTKFTVQLPLQTRGQVVADLKAEVDAGFTSRKRAIKALNPQLNDDEVENLIEEIDEETPTVEVPDQNQNGDNQNGMAENQRTDSEGSQTGTEDSSGGSNN